MFVLISSNLLSIATIALPLDRDVILASTLASSIARFVRMAIALSVELGTVGNGVVSDRVAKFQTSEAVNVLPVLVRVRVAKFQTLIGAFAAIEASKKLSRESLIRTGLVGIALTLD